MKKLVGEATALNSWHPALRRKCRRATAAWRCAKSATGFRRAVGRIGNAKHGQSRVCVRELPASLQAQPGVIELWLPPLESLQSQLGAEPGVLVGGLDLTR